MKNLTRYNKERIIRFINKYTKDYVEIPCPIGQGTEVRQALMSVAFAFAGYSGITGNQHEGYDGKPEFHYYALPNIVSPDDNIDPNKGICGIRFPVPQKLILEASEEIKNNYIVRNAIKYTCNKQEVYFTIDVDLKTNEFILTDQVKKDLELLEIDDIYEYVNIDNIM